MHIKLVNAIRLHTFKTNAQKDIPSTLSSTHAKIAILRVLANRTKGNDNK